jgi:hypothetical protein
MSRGKSALIGLAFIVALGVGAAAWALRSEDPWPLVYTKEGGIAGVSQELTLSEDGDAVVTDLISEDSDNFAVSANDMDRIATAIEEVDWASVESAGTTEGADLLLVTVDFGEHDSRGTLMTPQERTLLPLVGLLDEVIAKSRLAP